MNRHNELKRWNEIQERNTAMDSVAVALIYGKDRDMRKYGHHLACHVRKDELDDSFKNMGFGLLPLLEARNDVAIFAWFERSFCAAVTEYVDAIDDGKEFLEGVYRAYEEGVVGKHMPVPPTAVKKTANE